MGNKQSSGGLTKEQMDDLAKRTQCTLDTMVKTFKEDHPNSDSITQEEFKKYFLVRLGDGPLMDALWNSFDEDKSGTLDFKELILAFSMVEHGSVEQKLRMMFKLYDKDASGTITTDECNTIIGELLKIADARAKDDGTLSRRLREVMGALDSNKDGSITMDEWVHEWMKHPQALELLTNEF